MWRASWTLLATIETLSHAEVSYPLIFGTYFDNDLSKLVAACLNWNHEQLLRIGKDVSRRSSVPHSVDIPRAEISHRQHYPCRILIMSCRSNPIMTPPFAVMRL
jgi:hypothetical protein